MPLIAGEIKRFLRDNGAIKVSRILKQNGYQISKAKEALLHKYGREATLDELADYTGLCVEDIVMATEANREVESIQQTICGKDGTQVSLVERLVDEAQSEVAAENIMNRILVGQAMEKLGEMEQELIRLRFSRIGHRQRLRRCWESVRCRSAGWRRNTDSDASESGFYKSN